MSSSATTTSRHSSPPNSVGNADAFDKLEDSPSRQSEQAAPSSANVPFMYNNNHVSTEQPGGASASPSISYGGAGNANLGSSAPTGTPQANTPITYGGAAGNTQVPHGQSAQSGTSAAITYGNPVGNNQASSGTTKVDLSRPFNDGNVQIEYGGSGDGQEGPRQEHLSIRTGNGADNIRIGNSANGGISAQVNGVSYDIPLKQDDSIKQDFYVGTSGADDNISVDPGVTRPVTIEAGAGNDTVSAGSGRTRVLGGEGHDAIHLGRGPGYAEGNDGDDRITGGTGNSVMYGGNGKDVLRAGDGPATKGSYMDGGDGNDHLYGGSGHNVMNGGKGDDALSGGGDRNAIYTGKGQDTVNSYSDSDLIYGKETDSVLRNEKSTFEKVTPTDGGRQGFQVEGSPEFKQRVEDDMELLRGSPVGQQMLAKMDQAGAPVTIVEGAEGDFYEYRRRELAGESPEESRRENPAHGFLSDGTPGAPAENSELTYDRTFTQEAYNRPPVNTLYHEMAHAVNGAEGTFMPGMTYVGPHETDPDRPQYEPNLERQAIGLPTDGRPFDFDNDPSTPPTNTNPSPYNENALYREMGKRLRERYFDT